MDQQQISRRQAANSPEIALANEVFDQFCNATTLKSILGYYRHLCELLKIRPNVINQFYPKLKTKLRSWKAQALWKKFDQRASHKCYSRGKACPNTRILIIGGGPCGLRSAIEAQLLGAKVVVIEKRDRMSRNNVLHLWPFVIQDLRGLGAKKFFGKFCAGSIDHISIRQLQCILLKVALILGIEFHENVSFDSLIQPPNNQEDGKTGWRAKTLPTDHPVSQYEFDVLIGADGKRNTLEGFKRKEFRGKLAIAITANFINKRTEAEARVEEISGVAFIFNQKFFKELYQETGIDLENIVYYKDDTHYFVMTAKKHSLIDKGVILQDHADTAKLLAKENVDREALMLYAREAAEFSTEYQMVDMEFAVNHYGQPDVAMFDFTSMYAAENASRVLERHGYRLLMILVGDSLLEPFWPTGSGCARGFLSSLDAGWAIKGWGASLSPLEVIAERESIYRLLGQTTPENLNRDYAAYTLDPHTRYPNLNVRAVTPIQVRSLLDTDDPESVKQPTIQSEIDIPKKRRRRDLRIDAQTQVHPDTLLRWLQKQVAMYDKIHVEDMGASFKDGLAICAIIHRYRPDLIDFYNLNAEDLVKNNQLAFDTLEKELDIKPVMTGEEMAQCDVPDKLVIFSYLTQIYEAFRGEIPYVKHPKLEQEAEENIMNPKQLNQLMSEQKTMRGRRSSRHTSDNVQSSADKKGDTTSRRSRKRRSTEKMGATMGERQKKINETEEYRTECMKKRQYLRQMAIQQFYKSMRMLQANAKREKNEPFEDYAISLYRQTAPDFKDRVKDLEQKILYPDRETKIHVSYQKGNVDEEFSGRIRNFEDKLKGTALSEKKPKDLLRAIGKIEKTDWNVKEIEKKIEENKMGRSVRHDRIERVPKWSREQFLARQIKMEKRGNDPKDTYSKYADIDNTLKSIGKKIQEGSALGYNKVTAMAEQFSNKNQDAEPKMQKLKIKPTIVLPAQGGSEICHFCNKRVYLMERLSAEGKFFHRGCFRCEYCTISLRIGNHTFDREKNGGRFYCAQHFGLLGTLKTRAEKKKSNLVNKENEPNAAITSRTPEKVKISLEGVAGLDLLDRGQTPERIEFENLAGILDPDEAHSQMDEDEWTDRNFGASTAEMGSSDDISDMSDSDEDNEVFEEAIDQPLTTEGTLELAKNWTLRYTQPHATVGQSDTGSNEYEESSDEYTSEDDESGTATENEEDVRARELRKQEVWLKMPPRNSDTDTGSETEVNNFLGSIDFITKQKSFVSPDSKIIPSNRMDIYYCLSDKNDHRKSFEISKEFAFTSSNLAVNTCNQDNLILPNNDISPNVITQDFEYIIHATGPTYSLISNNNDNNMSQSRLLSSSPNIATNNYLTQEDRNFECRNFIDEDIWLNLNNLDHSVDQENVQNKIFDSNIINFGLTPIDFAINVNNFTDLGDIMTNSKLTLFADNLEEDVAHNDQNSLKQVAKAVPANATSCIEMDKDSIIFNSGNNLVINKSSDMITSLNESKDSLSSSSSEIYQSTEMLCSDSAISNNVNNSIKFLESNLPVEIEKCKCENTYVINKSKELITNKDRNIKLINDNNNIYMSEIIDKKINALTIIPTVTTNMQRESVCPIVTLTSPSPTQEKQFEELSMQTSRLLPPQNSYIVPNFVGCDSIPDKLKQDLKQQKARNKAIENELKPLSTECAQLKINKYFIESRNSISRSQPTWNEETETPNVKITKLDIKPKLLSKINAEEIVKYFDNSSFSNKRNKCKTYNTITKGAVEQNDCRKLEIDIEGISDMSEKDVDAINKEFNQIEKHNRISYLMDNQMSFPYNLSLEEYSSEEEVEHTLTCDNSGLVHNDLTELDPELNDDINYADSRILNYNILMLNNYNKNAKNSNTKLRSNISKLHANITCNILTPDEFIDQKNKIQIDITNEGKNMKKIDHTEETLEDDIKNINKEKGINVKLSNNMLESDVTKEDITEINLQNNIPEREVLLYKRNKQIIKINSMNDIDKNSMNNIHKNKKFFRNLSLEDDIHFNAELNASILLKNNTDNANKGNILYKSDTNLSKSDMNLNKNIPWVDFKDISNNNSKSLFELKNVMREIASVVEVADIKEIVDVSNNIKYVKIMNNNLTHCNKKILKETGQKHMSPDIHILKKNYSLETHKSTISSYTKSAFPEVPIRKKAVKKCVKRLNQHQNVESTSKLQDPIQDVIKLYGSTNNASNIQDQEKYPKIKSHNLNAETLKSENIDNVSENQRQNVPESQNYDTKSTSKQPRQNITKLQNQHVTRNESFNNEIIRDSKIIKETQNCNVINVPTVQCQNESVQSIKKSYISNWHLPDRSEKSTKFLSKNNESKKDKCVIS